MINETRAGCGSFPSIVVPGRAPKPIAIVAAFASASSARKKSRPSTPIIAPIRSSETINPTSACGDRSVSAASTGSRSNGASTSVRATARKSRICAGTRVLESPGISMMQVPILQNNMKTVRTVRTPMLIRRWFQAT